MDLIAIDIGNSSISIAVFDDDKIERIEDVSVSEPQKLLNILKAFREICGPQPFGASTVPVIVSSVNEKVLAEVEEVVSEALDQSALLVGRNFPLEMTTSVENPEAVGCDRLLAAYSAYEVIEGPCVIADFGTATTIDLVSESGIFVGGIITPGLTLAAKSLSDYTSALPLVKPILPEEGSSYGINSELAIQNGIFYSAIGALREMVERYATELGTWPQVVITGGLGKLIVQRCDFADSYVPNLVVNGLYLAYTRYRDGQDDEVMNI